MTVDDGSGPELVTLDADFDGGAWLHFPISVAANGQVTITANWLSPAGYNAVLAGLFLGGAPTSTVPGAPTNLVATAGDTTVQLTWSAPADDGGSPITGYTVTGSPGGTCSTTGATTCTASGLTNGTLYTFHVTATNAVGTGPESNAASATPQAAATVPGAPTNLVATAGDTTVQLTWSAPADDGGSPITGYTVTGSPGGTCSTTGATTCTASGLTNGTLYTFHVTATNAVGTGPESNAASATPQAAATVPGAPTNLVATAGDTTVQLTWSAPADDGGSPITGYTVTGSPGGTCSTTGATTCTASGLTNGTLYTFHVTATNAVGTGPESNAASATPQAAATVPGAPTNLVATAGDTTVQLTWSAPADDGGSPITGYTVTGSPGGTCSTTGATTCTASGLTNGTLYTFHVTATNAVGTGPESNAASATPQAAATVPGAPTNLRASASKSGGIDLTWTGPASNGGSGITGYRIYRSTSSGLARVPGRHWQRHDYHDGSTASRTRYYYHVTAVNGVGEGPSSNVANARTR